MRDKFRHQYIIFIRDKFRHEIPTIHLLVGLEEVICFGSRMKKFSIAKKLYSWGTKYCNSKSYIYKNNDSMSYFKFFDYNF